MTPGLLMPSADDDPRLEPGFTGGEGAKDLEPADASVAGIVVAELGLGRERVLSPHGRDEAAERWLAGDGGPDNQMTRLAPGVCETCGFFVRVQGGLASLLEMRERVLRIGRAGRQRGSRLRGTFHRRAAEPGRTAPAPVWETIEWDDRSRCSTELEMSKRSKRAERSEIDEVRAEVAAYVAAGADESVQRVITAVHRLSRRLNRWTTASCPITGSPPASGRAERAGPAGRR